jgi:hypothetical protein
MIKQFIAALRRYWNSAPADLRRNFSLDLTAATLVGIYVAAINFILTIFISLAFFGARDMWLSECSIEHQGGPS